MAKKDAVWFTKIRGSYLPKTFFGYVIYLVYVAYVVAVGVVWYNLGHDAWTLLTVVIPVVVLLAAATQFLASKNAK